jgi:enterochelin esterase family protein
MNMKNLLLLWVLIGLTACSATNNDEEPEVDAVNVEQQLLDLALITETSQREARADALWDSLEVNNLIPFTFDSTVLFLYRGNASSVEWNGDFNSWSNNRSFNNDGERIEGTDIWMLKTNFPPDARLDYKITLNGNNWILDPSNPHQQWSGFGPNSELRMPEWEPEPLTTLIQDVDRGSMSSNKVMNSTNLGYSVQYRVYTPDGYSNFDNLPVLYITDGHEYSDDRLGATTIVLDNLIHEGRIQPLIAVYVDPRNPNNLGENRRADQLGTNENYLDFYADELIPTIDNEYKTDASAESRVILGTSLGGLNATYFAFTRPDVFSGAAIQSPAYWYRDQIFNMVSNFDGDQPELFLIVGTIGDGTTDARTMKGIFEDKGYDFEYLEVSEGHSWGAWRAQIDDILLYFFGNREG